MTTKKTTNENTQKTAKIATKTVKKVEPETTPLEQENKLLKNELEELKKMILNLNTTSVTKTNNVEVVEDDYIEIKPNKYIKVISLENNPMVLSTEGYGKGKVFRFDKFGDSKNIVYMNLVDIIHHHQSFAESGRFYIVDRDVVKNHGLIEAYDKILSKNTIENILDFDKNDMIDIFKNATVPQKDTIVSLLVDKLNNKDDSVDLNKIDSLSRIYGKDISQLVESEIEKE